MNKTHSLLTVVLIGLLLMAATASGQGTVPTIMNYQGRLTDTDGNPVEDDTYTVQFRIYDEFGAERWYELHFVKTTDGLFSAVLGSQGTPLTEGVLNFDECWLGITVGADPEITPRTQLTVAPYAHRISTVDGATGGTITSDLNVVNDLNVGTPGVTGSVDVYMAGSANPVIRGTNSSTDGGSLDIRDETGQNVVTIEADEDGSGGYMEVSGGGAYNQYCIIDGNFSGTGNPLVAIRGTSSAVQFYTEVSGDLSVVLPEDAVSNTEILDEPGLTSVQVGAYLLVSISPMADVETVSITTPSTGYILVIAQANVRISGSTAANMVYMQIDETAGGFYSSNYYQRVGMGAYPNTSYTYYPVYLQRVYHKSAGTHTFRLEACKTAESHTCEVYRSALTAIFIPTSYGSVTTVVPDPAGFDNAVPVSMKTDDDNPGATETMYQVDLRELELRAARARATALEAEKALLEARARQK